MTTPGVQLLTSDVISYLQNFLASLGTYTPIPAFEAGPPTDLLLQKKSPNALVFVTVGDGIGLTEELTYDNPFVRIRAIGNQEDLPGSEKLALDIDVALCKIDSPQQVGNCARVLSIYRTGGRPTLLEQDKSNRYHWVNTYLAKAPSGI